MNSVVKRSGEKVPYDSSKIKKQIEMATEGIDVSPLVLESKIDLFMKNGIKTREIQQNVIQHAVQLATAKEPQWLKVAGKALAMDRWAEFKYRDKTFREVVQLNVKNRVYSKELLEFYSEEDLVYLGSVIEFRRDLDHSYSSLFTGYKKYIAKTELNQHMHMVNAMRFGQYEKPEERIKTVCEFYDILSKREFSLATPFMSNLRKGGNVASCFILAIRDDLDSIFDNYKNIAKISKNGGGIGIYLGMIRAKGSDVNGYKNAAGSIAQWVKIINDILVAVNQGGLRAGAGTVALPLWHNDILDFLDMQTEHGDPRLKSYDVFPQVVVNDLFMERDKQNGKWTTFCPFEVKTKLGIEMYGLWGDAFVEAYKKIEAAAEEGILKITRTLDARALMKSVMRPMFETGLPYTTFIDEINRQNPNKHDGYIPCVNLCTESFSNVVADQYTHVCNLGSINLGNIESFEHLAKVSRIATRMLDYGISLTNNPIKSTKDHNQRYRTIGIGVMGLHDYVAKNDVSFSDLDHISDIAECIQYNAVMESIDLAKKYGTFDAYEGSDWQNGRLTAKFASQSKNPEKWSAAYELMKMHGMRNSQLTSPAPTTSTQIYQDASATFLPIYSAFFSEDNSNGAMRVAAKYLDLNPLAYGKTQVKFDPIEIIDIAASIQQWFDTGMSMELILDHNREGFTAKKLYDIIHYAHQKGLKSIYYIRSIKKNESIKMKEQEACVACSG